MSARFPRPALLSPLLLSLLIARIGSWGITQEAAATRLGITRPRLNDLLRGKLGKFSLDALVNVATAAGLVLEIRVAGRDARIIPQHVGVDESEELPLLPRRRVGILGRRGRGFGRGPSQRALGGVDGRKRGGHGGLRFERSARDDGIVLEDFAQGPGRVAQLRAGFGDGREEVGLLRFNFWIHG